MAVTMADITKLRKMTGAGMLLLSVQNVMLLKVAFWLRLPVTMPLSLL